MDGSVPRQRPYTFLFTDIEGSSRLRERLRERYFDVVIEHHRLLRAAVEGRGGVVQSTEGDGIFAVFEEATEALAAAVTGQHALIAHPWPPPLAPPTLGGLGGRRVRMGLHTAEGCLRAGEYDSLGINYARRICDAGHGGQVLVSQATVALVEHALPEGVGLRDLGAHRFKGLEQPERLFQLLHPDFATDFPPLRTLPAFPSNLPSPLTRFIGRETELAEVQALMARWPHAITKKP